jgi:hypothetical protein
MERRHYLEVADSDLASITSISRIIDDDKVTGYSINSNNYNITVGEEYDLLVTLPADEPYKGIVAHTDALET